MTQQKAALGIDIGGTNTAFGWVETDGRIRMQGTMPTRGYADPAAYVQALWEAIARMPGFQAAELRGIGVGAPSANVHRGTIEYAPNMEWQGVIPIGALIAGVSGLPVRVTNDANAAAMGEMIYGAAKGMRDFIMVTLGTGVGSGFVVNGELLYGHDGFAGELGHVIAVRDGRPCGCGRNGCLEAYASATGIVRTAVEKLSASEQASILRNHSGIQARDLFEAAEQGDALAKEVFAETGRILGQTLADAVAITSPEAIILFGGLARAGEHIFAPVRQAMEANLLNLYQGKVNLLHSQLPESDAAILGAAALV